jgi:peptidoglycan/xylan/chitin deacetylase (PgdA/CDA1 family)
MMTNATISERTIRRAPPPEARLVRDESGSASMITRVLASLLSVLLLAAPVWAVAPELPQVAAAARTPYLAVLVWHDVVAGPKEVWFDTTLDTFRAQLRAIQRGGYHVIGLQALRSHLEHGTPVPSRPLALTFDDNGHGIYENAFPLLKKYGFPATLFVHTNFVGKTTSKRHNTWAQLIEMERSGLIDIQSLTANHPPDLRPLSDANVVHEFTLARKSIEARIGRVPYAVVYPEDNYDERLARLAAATGYSLGFTEDWGNAGASDSLLLVHRYSVLTRFDQALADVAQSIAQPKHRLWP